MGLTTKEHIVMHNHLNFVSKRALHISTLAIKLFSSSTKLFYAIIVNAIL